jgi:hypothetical protein
MDEGFIKIIHPDLGPDSVSEVPASSLPSWVQSGWRPLAEDDVPAAAPVPEPEPMTRAEAAKTAGKTKEK